MYMYIYMYIYVYLYIHTYICIYVTAAQRDESAPARVNPTVANNHAFTSPFHSQVEDGTHRRRATFDHC